MRFESIFLYFCYVSRRYLAHYGSMVSFDLSEIFERHLVTHNNDFRYGGNFSCKVMQVLKQFSMTWNSFAVFVIGLGKFQKI